MHFYVGQWCIIELNISAVYPHVPNSIAAVLYLQTAAMHTMLNNAERSTAAVLYKCCAAWMAHIGNL
jgi:hypothetical protein